MLKKTITYRDFNDEERTEDLYFNLSKTELIEMQYSEAGGLQERIRNILQLKDAKEIMATFKDIVLKSYGIKSPDGRRFDKSEEIRKDFECSAAYDTFITSLLDGGNAAEFINGVIPKEMREEVAKETANNSGMPGIPAAK